MESKTLNILYFRQQLQFTCKMELFKKQTTVTLQSGSAALYPQRQKRLKLKHLSFCFPHICLTLTQVLSALQVGRLYQEHLLYGSLQTSPLVPVLFQPASEIVNEAGVTSKHDHVMENMLSCILQNCILGKQNLKQMKFY